jgi:uncharacterized protein YbgA (DUF1722 family)
VECGLGIPREPLRLVGDPDSPRLATSRTGQDLTERMARWAQKRVAQLEKADLSGFILKSGSPSSGMERVRVYQEGKMPIKRGVGIFARIFMEHFPLLPVEEERRLHDPKLRENFIERAFTLKRWRETLAQKASRANLVDFHTRHKLLILSHSPQHHQQMEKLVAGAKDAPLNELYPRYQALLMESLRLKATPRKNANVLMHIMGCFKQHLSADEKQELLHHIDSYRRDSFPLLVPLTLLNHYVRKYNQPHLKQQVYLNPHPIELQLRNHA